MKAYISNFGLSSPVENSISEAKRRLLLAKNSIESAPNGFSHANFVNNLSSTIDGYIKEVDRIYNTLISIEKKYDNFLTDKKIEFQSINEYKVPDRRGIGHKIDQEANYNINGTSMVGLMSRQTIHKKN